MGLQRLDDAELGRRTRERNTRANQVHRERLLNAGKRQTNVWLSAALRERLDALAMDQGAPLSEIAEQVLSAGLTALAAPSLPVTPSPSVEATPAPESLPLFEPASTERGPADTGSFNQDLAAFKTAVIDAWNSGTRGYGSIATALEAGGYRNSRGNPYPRSHVKAVLVKAGLVAETGKATQENGE